MKHKIHIATTDQGEKGAIVEGTKHTIEGYTVILHRNVVGMAGNWRAAYGKTWVATEARTGRVIARQLKGFKAVDVLVLAETRLKHPDAAAIVRAQPTINPEYA
jgi:ribosomal protein S28E/S33